MGPACAPISDQTNTLSPTMIVQPNWTTSTSVTQPSTSIPTSSVASTPTQQLNSNSSRPPSPNASTINNAQPVDNNHQNPSFGLVKIFVYSFSFLIIIFACFF